MIQAATLVEGEHDFTSFAAVDPEKRRETLAADQERLAANADLEPDDAGLETNSADRELKQSGSHKPALHKPELHKLDLELNNVRTIFLSQWQRHGDELIYTVRGNGFLHHMVRNLVGTFLMVGKGSLSVADVRRILELRDRSAAAATAPASGLFLVSVEY